MKFTPSFFTIIGLIGYSMMVVPKSAVASGNGSLGGFQRGKEEGATRQRELTSVDPYITYLTETDQALLVNMYQIEDYEVEDIFFPPNLALDYVLVLSSSKLLQYKIIRDDDNDMR